MAKGGYDSNGETTVAPEPLGVAYGKKIGVGGFGAVYEGEWNEKQVAVKVRALPSHCTCSHAGWCGVVGARAVQCGAASCLYGLPAARALFMVLCCVSGAACCPER